MTLPFAATSPSEFSPDASLRLQRTEGASRVAFKFERNGTRLDRLYQSGAAKVRLPVGAAGEPPQAVLINTAGGLTGGDKMSAEVILGARCHAVVTTPACEKIYRASLSNAEIRTELALGKNARLDWLPQETILFDGARLSRRLEANLAPGAELLLVEATIFGRSASGESVQSGLFADCWRICRDGRLVFADDLRFDFSDANLLHRPAVLAAAAAMATILFVADEPARDLAALREIIGKSGGISAWNGKLLARITAKTGAALRQTLSPLLAALRGGASLPKFWRI
jgi:urease accessory protein